MTDGICQVNSNFLPGFICKTSKTFGIMRDGSLLIASLNCFTWKPSFKMAPKLYQKKKKEKKKKKKKKFLMVCQKAKKNSCSPDHTTLLNFHQQILLRNVWRDIRLSMSASTTVTRKSLNVNFTSKIDVLIGFFTVPLLILTWEV